jgi:hypothetical protein
MHQSCQAFGVFETEALYVEATLDVMAFALDSFIDALIDDTIRNHKL